jgi:hypothetical protein
MDSANVWKCITQTSSHTPCLNPYIDANQSMSMQYQDSNELQGPFIRQAQEPALFAQPACLHNTDCRKQPCPQGLVPQCHIATGKCECH